MYPCNHPSNKDIECVPCICIVWLLLGTLFLFTPERTVWASPKIHPSLAWWAVAFTRVTYRSVGTSPDNGYRRSDKASKQRSIPYVSSDADGLVSFLLKPRESVLTDLISWRPWVGDHSCPDSRLQQLCPTRRKPSHMAPSQSTPLHQLKATNYPPLSVTAHKFIYFNIGGLIFTGQCHYRNRKLKWSTRYLTW